MNTLVVARHREDIRWLVDVPVFWRTMLVQKDKHVPNVGREATSYLWAILELYDRLDGDDQVAFVQGNPFDHCPRLIEELLDFTHEFSPLGEWRTVTDGEGRPDHPGLPVAERFTDWFGVPWPGKLFFTAGAQFMVPGRKILKHPKSSYETLMGDVMAEEKGAWLMERYWESLLS